MITEDQPPKQNDYVVLLHGILLPSLHLYTLAKFLSAHGYTVFNVNYPSTKYPLEELIPRTAKQIDDLLIDKNRKVHFVGFSMGGIMARGIIAQHRPQNLGRVVQIGTPNHGSEVADFWKNNILFKKIFGPAGQQLTTHYDLAPLLGNVDYELGVLAGNFTFDPVSSYIIHSPNDGKVSVESTKLEGMRDHITLSASHTFFPFNKTAHEQVLAFIKNGQFNQ